jgi:Amt family ammonium transporter
MISSSSSLRRWYIPALAVGTVLAASSMGFAQDAAPTTAPAQAAAEAAPTIDSGATAWMLMSTALVLFMLPGLALFYGGMVRAKSVLNTFLNVMICTGVIGVIWVVVGYAIAFAPAENADGSSNVIISLGKAEDGTTTSLLSFDKSLVGLSKFGKPVVGEDGAVTDGSWSTPSGAIPELLFAMFQGMFAIITPALIVGAVAERVRLGPLLVFLSIWSIVVYCPMAHMVWNANGYLFQLGALDFAGGTVVHVLAGVSGLALCIVVGPRTGWGKSAMAPHSLGLTLVGAGMLWFGWYGFNAGSALAADGTAVLPLATTTICASAAALSWTIVEWLKDGKPTILGFASGVVGGLVVITPAAGHVSPFSALILGLIGGAVCYFGCQLKKVFKYDDSLDAFGVHGIGGALGAILVGLFAIRPVLGGGEQLGKQFIGLAIAVVFAFVASPRAGAGDQAHPRPAFDSPGRGRRPRHVALHGESGYNLSISN